MKDNLPFAIGHKQHGHGFTLLELLLTVGIILIAAAFVFYFVAGALAKSQAARVTSDFNMTQAAFRLWMTDTNNFVFPSDDANNPYPPGPFGSSCREDEPLLSSTDLFSNVSGRPGWNGPYLSKGVRAPWGKEYLYDNDDDTYPTGGTHSGVNFRLVWCNKTEEKQHLEMIKHLDGHFDKSDGQTAGIVRWASGDQGKLDLLINPTKNAQ